MIIHPLRDVWGAYAIRPYTGYVHSARAFGPFRGRQGTRVGAYCIRPTGRHHRWRIHVPGYDHSSLAGCLGGVCDTPLHRVRAFGTCIRALSGASGYPCRGVLHTPTGRPGTGRIHVPGYDHSSLAGCLGGVFNTPLHRYGHSPVSADTLFFRQMDVGIAVAGAAA